MKLNTEEHGKQLENRTWHDGTDILDILLQDKKFTKPGRFLSIGANIGNDWSWSLLSKGWKGVLIEPDPFACAELIKNCQQWNKNQIDIINAAVSNQSGLSDFYVSMKSSWNSSMVKKWQSKMLYLNPSKEENDKDYITNILVSAITMQNLIHKVGSDFNVVVIDAEGMDPKIVLSTDWSRFKECELLCIEHEFAEIEPHLGVINHLKSYGFTFTDQDNAHAIYKRFNNEVN